MVFANPFSDGFTKRSIPLASIDDWNRRKAKDACVFDGFIPRKTQPTFDDVMSIEFVFAAADYTLVPVSLKHSIAE
jgi:hypothetical protein